MNVPMGKPAETNLDSSLAEMTPARATPSLVLVGTSFRTADIGTREGIARRLSRLSDTVAQLGGGRVRESSILQTCNRIEIYLISTDPDGVALSVMRRLDKGETESNSFYLKTGSDAIGHLFKVAAGLDSPVLGEEQILQQVRDAGKTARTSGQAKSALSSLFDAAYSSGMRTRHSYRGSSTGRSVSTFALERALKELGRRPARVLLIGSGETAKLAALRLRDSVVYLLSARPDTRARFPNAIRVSRRSLRSVTAKCDLIITATRHRGYVLTRRNVSGNGRKVILDLGFPRNVDPALRDSKFIRLYDLDDVASWTGSEKRKGLELAERLVEEEARRFNAWLTATRLTPTLATIYKWAEGIRKEEAALALRRLDSLTPRQRTIVEAMTKRLTGKLMAPHATFVKGRGIGDDQAERLRLLESIFQEGGR